ncbi:MAG: FKBP-type peptidyl-prolyl cis-trans isomerase [Bacteroidales bacterium]
MKIIVSAILITACFLFTSFPGMGQNEGDFQKTPNGLKYKFFNQNKQGEKAKSGEMVTVSGYYKVRDTIFFDSRKSPTPYIFPVGESAYPGDIFEGIRMMTVGDSALFVVSGDSLFLKTFRVKSLPKYCPPNSEVSFYVKMLKKQPKDEFQKEMQAKFEEDNKKSMILAAKEDSIIKDYLKKNNLKAEATTSGLYVVEVVKGMGVKAEPGKQVTVQYTGKLMDGTVFDSSVGKAEPFSFPLGKNKVIRGWEEGIAKMNKGGKAILLIPSKLGYGASSVGKIPSDSILIFEVELINVQ